MLIDIKNYIFVEKRPKMEIIIATLSPVFINILGGLFLLVCNSKRYINRRYLSLFMFNSFLLFLGHFFYFHKYIALYHRYDFIFLFALLSFFPLYYLYIKSVFNIEIKLKEQLFHFFPAIIISISSLTLSLTSDHINFSNYFFKITKETEINGDLSFGLFYVYQIARAIHLTQITVYSILIIHFILKKMKPLKNYLFKMQKNKTLTFIAINSFFMFFMITSGFIITLYGRTIFVENIVILYLSSIIFSVIHLMICLHGVKQIPVNTKNKNERLYYEKEIISYNIYKIEKQLLLCLEKDRPWLNPNLKIKDLTILTGTNRTYLSKIINDHFKNNFNDFINEYRIKEALSIMDKDYARSLSLKEVAENSGFGSVSTFRRAFKKVMGKTASEYQKKPE